MEFYFFIFTVLAILSFLEIHGMKAKVSKANFIFVSFLFFLLSFLRWETGTDWINYTNLFNRSYYWFLETEFEWGYSRLNEFVKIYFDSFTVLLFIMGSILFFFQNKAILRFSPYPLISLFFLWSISFANTLFIRQSVSTMILFYSIRYIQEKKLSKFLLMILLATLFHRSSLIFIIAWWIYHIKIKPLYMLIFILVSVSTSVLVASLFESLTVYLGGDIADKITIYLEDEGSTQGVKTSLIEIIIKGFANKILIFLIGLHLIIKNKDDIYIRGYFNIYWVGMFIYFSTITISIAFIRLSFAFDMVQILILPFYFKSIKNFHFKNIVFFVFILYLSLRLYTAVDGYYELYVPFKTIFTK